MTFYAHCLGKKNVKTQEDLLEVMVFGAGT